jgi:AAA+ ATPase superfamily predicted ATPase
LLFDERPKDNLKYLFGRKNEVAELEDAISRPSPLIIITGLRRVGKTSVMKTVITKRSKFNIIIDLRDLGSKKHITRKDVVNLFQSSIQQFLDSHESMKAKFVDIFRSVRGVTVGPLGVNFDWQSKNELDFRSLFDKLNTWAKNNNTIILVAVDEAQEFRKSQHVDMNSIFASIYDSCKNIILILTGSEIGLLHEFLGLQNPKSPLFGRIAWEIKIKPLDKTQSENFLVQGFAQEKIKITQKDSHVISEASEELGGIIGWLIKFGLTCVRKKQISSKYILETKKDGAILARSEFDKFLENRTAKSRYETIMTALAARRSGWKSLKDYLELKSGETIYDKNFNDLLDSLLKSSFIEKTSEEYFISDPLLRFSFLS